MNPKIAHAKAVGRICLALFALIASGAFAASEASVCNRSVTRSSIAPRRASTQPMSNVGDDIFSATELRFAAIADACSDSIANCGDPVKHLGTQNDCACFACGYGTPGQRNICTKNAADKAALFKRAR